jgi:hypothetical protein
MPAHMPRELAPELPEEDEPTAEEIAAHTQDEDEPSDDEILGVTVARPVLVTETNQLDTSVSRPNVQDIPQTRTSFKGQARQARDTPSQLPDVKTRIRRPTEHDHDRARG